MGTNLYQSDYPSVVLAEINVNVAGGVRGIVFTNQVPQGFYWWIPFLHVADSDATAQNIDLWLVDPSVFPPAAAQATGTGLMKIAPINGVSGTSDFITFQTQASRATVPFFLSTAIIVPSLFALAAVEVNNAVSGSARTLSLRYGVGQFRNGCAPPIY